MAAEAWWTVRIAWCMLVIGMCGCSETGPPGHVSARLADTPFRLELALTDRQIQQGMAGREHLEKDAGMLFVFRDERVRRFWMKGCLIPLDVVFTDGSGRIVAIHTMAVPELGTADDELPGYSSHWPAQFAVELNAGRAGELGLKPGDHLALPVEQLKRWAERRGD